MSVPGTAVLPSLSRAVSAVAYKASSSAAALRRDAAERSTPAPCVMMRWTSYRASAGWSGPVDGTGMPGPLPADALRTMSSAIRSAKTRPSSREFEASRFAPCTPVQATSPHAYRPGTVVRPCRSVRMPPEA